MVEKVLFVDDVPAILEGYKRLLHGEFPIETAVGGKQGLAVLSERGPFAVVVSDMRMPEMDGVEFLSLVKERFPETVRMVLTGYADMESAMNAVNEGNIFRFLTKPCARGPLAKAVWAALLQHRLITGEKELLEKTLRGSIKAMAEILSVTNPAAFGRTTRLQRYVQHLIAKLNIAPCWQYEIATMLSQLGCVTLDPEIIEAVNAGEKLSPEEQARFDMHPRVAWELLSHIPRMEAVASIIVQQQGSVATTGLPEVKSYEAEIVQTGVQLLRAALAYDRLLSQGRTPREAVEQLSLSAKGLEFAAARALADYESASGPTTACVCEVSELTHGMVLEEDVRTTSGMVVVARGQEITPPLAMRLHAFGQRGMITGSIRVRVATAIGA